MERAVRVHLGDLNPRFFNWPSLYMYVLAGVYGLVFGASPDGVAGAFARNPALFYLAGRLVTALFGTATLAVLYCTGRMAYGPAVGILAAGLLAVDLLHVRDSHWVTPDVPLTFLVALATLCALRYWRDGRRADAGVAGLVVGLAAAMKYPGGLAFLGLVAAHAARRPGLPAWRRVAGKDTILGAGLATLGFLLGTPFALLTPAAFVRGVLAELREVHTVQFGNEADAPAYLFHLAYSLPEAMGWPLYLLALAGLGWALAVRGAREVVLLAFAVPYLLVIATWSARFERYAIPLLPCLTLLAAVAVTRGVSWLSGRVRLAPPWPAITLVAAAVLLVAPALARVTAYHRLLAEPDTRELGSAWVERHVPPGTRIALEPYSLSLPVASPQLREEPGSWGLQAPRPAGLTTAPAGSQDGYWLVRLHTYDLDRLLRSRSPVRRPVGLRLSALPPGLRLASGPVPLLRRAGRAGAARLQRLTRRARRGRSALLVGDIYSPLTRLRRAPASRSSDPHLPASARGARVTLLARALPVAFLAAVGLAALRPIDDPDFWWLLRAGRYMIETQSFPTTDPFSATAFGAEWLNHAWGFELLVYGIYALGGTTGVILLQGLVAATAFGVLWGLLRREGVGQGWSLGLLSLGALATHGFWSPRPQLVTYLMLAVFVRIVADYQAGRANRLWWLPILTAVWANLHAGFLAGPGLLALCAAGEFLGWLLGDDSGRAGGLARARTLALWFGASLAASLANPFHYEAVLFPFHVMGDPLSQAWISEWLSPRFGHPAVLVLELFLGLTLLLALGTARPVPWRDLALLVPLVHLALQATRNTPLLVIGATPIVGRALASCVGRTGVASPRWAGRRWSSERSRSSCRRAASWRAPARPRRSGTPSDRRSAWPARSRRARSTFFAARAVAVRCGTTTGGGAT